MEITTSTLFKSFEIVNDEFKTSKSVVKFLIPGDLIVPIDDEYSNIILLVIEASQPEEGNQYFNDESRKTIFQTIEGIVVGNGSNHFMKTTIDFRKFSQFWKVIRAAK